MIIDRNGTEEHHSFWSNTQAEESRLFQQFVDVVAHLDEYCLYSYGSYDVAFLRRMIKESGRHNCREDPHSFGKRPLDHLFTRLLPYLFQQSKGHREVFGIQVDGSGHLGHSEYRWRNKWEATARRVSRKN